jgi:phospholipid/cholesterol/gamma-HCH transport system substrate-binding protein
MVAKRSLGRRLMPFIAGAAVLGLIITVLSSGAGSDDKVLVSAVFEDSSPLTLGNEVRSSGALVGKITGISLVNGKSRVDMEVDRKVLPLHTDATAKIEPVSLLGERFVALGSGTPNSPVLSDPALIDLKHTTAAVDLDELLNTLDNPTSTALAAVVTTFGQGLEGNGANADKALRGLAPTFGEVDKLSQLLDQHNALLDHFIVQVQRDLDQISPPMDSLVDGANQAFSTTAANRRALEDTLGQFPPTLVSARNTLAQLGTTADSATSVLRDIRPLTGELRNVSTELRDFSAAAAPALDSLPELMDRLDTFVDEARPVIKDVVPMAHDLAKDSDSLNKFGMQVLRHKNGVASGLEQLMSGIAQWALVCTDYDGLSHYIRANLSVQPNEFGTLATGALPPLGSQPPFNPVQRDPNGQTGHPGSPALPGVPPLSPLTPDTSRDAGDAPNYHGPNSKGSREGLTPTQEGNMFNSLLGGGR